TSETHPASTRSPAAPWRPTERKAATPTATGGATTRVRDGAVIPFASGGGGDRPGIRACTRKYSGSARLTRPSARPRSAGHAFDPPGVIPRDRPQYCRYCPAILRAVRGGQSHPEPRNDRDLERRESDDVAAGLADVELRRAVERLVSRLDDGRG